ncbi:endonuclease/exonuclease/phosphatase family metal-dependent hydrolase [Tamilnaduibacter salinus]|uniref:Endonuclease/exonuclease/phosphatase family metal-dependent hydrolase n=1 Tax=Tamilnaduibacter salinus TaxID=1484056 RepID=A0A2U1CWD4_9GAMM|nr:sphingomyelin phosphodiesterase [Tamilnaduibacter salinus]PVY76253.1 endonuclease/exonuclease/phosphatase family metal-dependent hydrolase [Tamilnaduibacter salinus]
MTLRVLTYNIRMLGAPSNIKNKARADEIKDRIRAMDPLPDVIIFQELFVNAARTILLEGRKRGWFGPREGGLLDAGYTATNRPNKPGRLRNGGVMILSRHGLVNSDTDVFEHATLAARRQAKGVVHARVRKDGQDYHVFGTHTQGGGCGDNVIEARRNQIREMGRYIRQQIGNSTDPVIVAGDLNVGGCADIALTDVPELIRETDRSEVTGPEVRHLPLPDGQATTLDGEALDHFFVSAPHHAPEPSTVRRLDWTSGIATRSPFDGRTLDGHDRHFLSDHHPVLADLVFTDSEERASGHLAGRVRRGSWSDERRFCAALIFTHESGDIEKRVMASDGHYAMTLPEGRYRVDVLTTDGETRVTGDGFVVVRSDAENTTYNILLDES